MRQPVCPLFEEGMLAVVRPGRYREVAHASRIP